jgi:hypothetical protein
MSSNLPIIFSKEDFRETFILGKQRRTPTKGRIHEQAQKIIRWWLKYTQIKERSSYALVLPEYKC